MSNTVKLPVCPKCGLPIPQEAPQGLCPKCVLLGAATATEQGVPATATSEIPSIERIAAAFPQLEILELIGRGGMGFVFKARQPHLDRFVALKLLPDKLAKDALFAERFNREGRVLAKLNHPNIVSVFDFGQTGGFYYLTMEYVDGVNLRQAMRAGRFSPAEALALVPKVCEALQYAHEQGILHRDIKPENILLDTKGRVKIADFGIAKLVGEDQPNITLTNTGAALGTPHYMAPEQLEKPATVDHRADIYSLGVVFYEMLTGELPIGRFAAPSSKTPVNSTVDDVVFRTLEKDRERRFQSAGEMRTQVEHLGTGAFEQPEDEEDADDDAPRSWLEAVHSMRLAGWFLAAFCLVNFAFPHVTRLGNSPANTYSLGLSRPWLVNVPLVDAHNVLTREWRFNPSTTSFGTGMLGLALLAALLVLRHRVRAAPFVPRSAARISNWSIYGAISVGLSLPAPMTILVALLTGMGGVEPGELWLALGSVALPGLGGTLLGWLALNQIRESRGRVKGLPLAMFATLFWPLTILGAVTIGVPMFLLVPGGEPSVAQTFGRFLVLLLPAAVIAFSFWAIHATARWAGQRQIAQQRGVLKWVFIVVLLIGMGVVLVTQNPRESQLAAAQRVSAVAKNVAADQTAPKIQFTFTSVELRDEAGSRWLAVDYVEQARGGCEHTFRYDAQVPGFTAQTRMDSALSDAKAGFDPVTHQRVLWKLPGSMTRSNSLALRDLVAKEWVNKSVVIEPGDERVLFKSLVREGGTLAAAVGVRLTTENTGGGSPPRKVLLNIPTLENDSYHSLMVTTDSELPVGDYLVGLLQRADGQIEEHPATTIIYSGWGRTREMRHILWSMGQFGSNRVREFAAGMRASLDGRVVELTSGRRVPVFSVTNDQGGTVAGFLILRSHRLPATGPTPVSVSIVDVPQHWVHFLSVKLRVSAPPGYMPLAVGLMGDGSPLETHTSISGDGKSDAGCYWYLPPEFAADDVQEVIRQLVATKVTSPNGIVVPSDQRVPVFSVTNKAGVIFRGYFEMRKSAIEPALTASMETGAARKGLASEPEVPKSPVATRTPEKPAVTLGPPRKIQLRTYESDKYQSLSITSDSELPVGEYLVGLLQRPDGKMVERSASTTIYAGERRTRVLRHLLWSMSQFNSNRIQEIAADLKAAMNGRVIDLVPEQRVPLFSVTNAQGGTVSGFITVRSHALPAANEPAATISVERASVASQFFLSASLRITSPPGYLPNAVGLMGDGSELKTHTSIFGGSPVGSSARDMCLWYFPKDFQAGDLQEIVRQLVETKVTSPNGIKVLPGERVPVFAVTNQVGTIFRGCFELPDLNGMK